MNKRFAVALGAVGAMTVTALTAFGAGPASATLVHALTIASLLFLVGAGLSVVFGFGHILNLAHTALFMLGAQVAAAFATNPPALIAALVHPAAFAAGLLLGRGVPRQLIRVADPTRQVVGLGGILLWAGIWLTAGKTALRIPAVLPLELTMLAGVHAALLLGAVVALVALPRTTRRSRRSARRGLAGGAALAAVSYVAAAQHVPMGQWIAAQGRGGQFVLSLAAATAVVALVGAALHRLVLRKTGGAQQIVSSLFALMILVEVGIVFFGRNVLLMPRPPRFSGSGPHCPADSIADFWTGCDSFRLLGEQTSTYRLLIVLMAVILLLLLWWGLENSRIGMTVRAGVEDADMARALGVNVDRVVGQVFVLGAAVAGLAGAVAAPFLGAHPDLARQFLVPALIVVIIGGIGSLRGAALAALVLGTFSALADQTVLTVGLSPSLSKAAAVFLLVVVLLIRPEGLDGRKAA
jgi:branched-chain amino acid transport system permease protein